MEYLKCKDDLMYPVKSLNFAGPRITSVINLTRRTSIVSVLKSKRWLFFRPKRRRIWGMSKHPAFQHHTVCKISSWRRTAELYGRQRVHGGRFKVVNYSAIHVRGYSGRLRFGRSAATVTSGQDTSATCWRTGSSEINLWTLNSAMASDALWGKNQMVKFRQIYHTF